jgi:uncharacterized protein YndB with AHSA1/START domain
MDKQLKKSYEINAPVSRVWDALTDPRLIKKYFFGTDASDDFREGGTVLYKGIFDGKSYQDKGKILEFIPERKMTIDHWSSRSGKPDAPENYSSHSYNLTPSGNKTKLIMSQQDNYETDESRAKAWNHWDVVVDGLKKIVEEAPVLAHH